jgi:hypothetical protein
LSFFFLKTLLMPTKARAPYAEINLPDLLRLAGFGLTYFAALFL